MHSLLVNFIVTSNEISRPLLFKGRWQCQAEYSFFGKAGPLSDKNFEFLETLKADKLERQTYQMDYCAHENNLLHRSERYENSEKSKFCLF